MTTPIDIVDIDGEPHARGRAFGRARRQQIQACLSDWFDTLRGVGIADPQAYIGQMLADTDFVSAIREHAPDLLEEVRGIAAGSEHPYELLLAAQFMDEEWAYRPAFQGRGEAGQKCSSVAIQSRGATTWIGQNMDLGGYTDGHQLVLRIAPQAAEPGALIFTIGGMIGLLGVNGRGVGVCVNSLPQLPAARTGVPVAFVIRRLLQAASVTEAARLVRELPHATGQHYLIADPTGIRSFEASPAQVLEYRSPDPSRVLHTNHPLAEEKGATRGDLTNSVARLKSLTDRLMAGEPDLEAIRAALSASDDPNHPVCRVAAPGARVNSVTGMIGFTTGSMVSALSEEAPAVDSWVSAGPPSVRGYNHVRLDAKLRAPSPSRKGVNS